MKRFDKFVNDCWEGCPNLCIWIIPVVLIGLLMAQVSVEAPIPVWRLVLFTAALNITAYSGLAHYARRTR